MKVYRDPRSETCKNPGGVYYWEGGQHGTAQGEQICSPNSALKQTLLEGPFWLTI